MGRDQIAIDRLLVDSAESTWPCGVARSPETPPARMIGMEDDLITLAQAARLLPRIDGKKVAISTIWRWCRNGLRGERLEYVRVGRKICTSPEALHRFFTKPTEADTHLPPDTRSLPPGMKRPLITSKQRQKALAEAEKVLRRAGI